MAASGGFRVRSATDAPEGSSIIVDYRRLSSILVSWSGGVAWLAGMALLAATNPRLGDLWTVDFVANIFLALTHSAFVAWRERSSLTEKQSTLIVCQSNTTPMKVSAPKVERISTIDSHTCGEPTRTIVSGGPVLGSGTLLQRQHRFAKDFDHYRSAVINEPRGNDVLVGALLCKPSSPECAAGVIFFNNLGYLGMCGRGVIGVAVTLAYLGRIGSGYHQLETPVGVVGFELDEDLHRVTFESVASYRYRANVAIDVPGFGEVVGDIAWGGNWFFLVRSDASKIRPQHLDDLLTFSKAIRKTLEDQQIHGYGGQRVDHVQLHCDSGAGGGRNFVLGPGGQWDRSPCSTGTNAKVACLAAEGKLDPGKRWHQESIIGTRFESRYRVPGLEEVKQLGLLGIAPSQSLGDTVAATSAVIIPSIAGEASVTAESQLMLDPDDAFRYGIPV